MGMFISSLSRLLRKDKNFLICASAPFAFGLTGAGKSTMLFRLKRGGMFTTIPTVGFNVEQVEYTYITFTICDVGGPQRISTLDEQHFREAAALIYVVDGSDVDRVDEACERLHEILNHPLMARTTILVFANKQDLPNSIGTTELTKRLQLKAIMGRDSHIQSSNAETSFSKVSDGLRGIYEIRDEQTRQPLYP